MADFLAACGLELLWCRRHSALARPAVAEVLEASGLIFRPLWYKPQARRWRNTPLYPGRGDIVYALAARR